MNRKVPQPKPKNIHRPAPPPCPPLPNKKEGEECNEFINAVSRMREIQRMGGTIYHGLETEKRLLEKQVDDFLDKWGIDGNISQPRA